MNRSMTMLALLFAGGAAARSTPVRIMPVGDSITHGYYSGGSNFSGYRKELKNLLDANGYSTDFAGSLAEGDFADNQHEGHDGWHAYKTGNTNNVLEQVAGWLAATPADIILLHIGTNDIHDNPGNPDAGEVSDILDEIFAANTNATVVLALIIRADTNTFPWSAAVSTFNSNVNAMAQARIAAGDDIIMVDMETGTGLDYTSADMIGFHPSQTGYDKMATNWYPAVRNAILHQLEPSTPHIDTISITSNTVSLTIGKVVPETPLRIEQSESLSPADWTFVDIFTPSNTPVLWTDTRSSTNPIRFFRAVIK